MADVGKSNRSLWGGFRRCRHIVPGTAPRIAVSCSLQALQWLEVDCKRLTITYSPIVAKHLEAFPQMMMTAVKPSL